MSHGIKITKKKKKKSGLRIRIYAGLYVKGKTVSLAPKSQYKICPK